MVYSRQLFKGGNGMETQAPSVTRVVNPIVVALDGMDLRIASQLASELKGVIHAVKLHDILLEGKWSLEWTLYCFRRHGVKIFVDLKFCDTPETVGHEVRRLSAMGVDYISVAAWAGKHALESAVSERGNSNILALVLPTWLSETEIHSQFGKWSSDVALQFTALAVDAGVQGIIIPVPQLRFVSLWRTVWMGHSILVVTPGIRPRDYRGEDHQQWTVTPEEAVRVGASMIVVGRPITRDPQPVKAAQRILASVRHV
ncbi:MAG: orotidine-5'-phosphate decarboxylase [Parcubacteria group bacterium]|nr:orotidine-5'-phosphate decarboxylase [Parcubacteria group bacterium]